MCLLLALLWRAEGLKVRAAWLPFIVSPKRALGEERIRYRFQGESRLPALTSGVMILGLNPAGKYWNRFHIELRPLACQEKFLSIDSVVLLC